MLSGKELAQMVVKEGSFFVARVGNDYYISDGNFVVKGNGYVYSEYKERFNKYKNAPQIRDLEDGEGLRGVKGDKVAQLCPSVCNTLVKVMQMPGVRKIARITSVSVRIPGGYVALLVYKNGRDMKLMAVNQKYLPVLEFDRDTIFYTDGNCVWVALAGEVVAVVMGFKGLPSTVEELVGEIRRAGDAL